MVLKQKSIRITKQDAISLGEIISLDPRVERGQSEAIYYSFKDAAKNIPDWVSVSNMKFPEDKNAEIDSEEYSINRTFSVAEEDFEIIRKSINDQLGLTRPRISFIVRLCITALRMRLAEMGTVYKQIDFDEKREKSVDSLVLVKKFIDLVVQADNSPSEVATQKIISIKKILEE